MKKKIKKSDNKTLKADTSNTLQDLKEVGVGVIVRIVFGIIVILLLAMGVTALDFLF